MSEMYQEITEKTKLLDSAIYELRERGKASAKAERDYRVALATIIIMLRDEKMPVTIISDVARGEEHISKLKMERDIADVLYKSALEAINAYKLQLRLLENQLERDYGQAKRH